MRARSNKWKMHVARHNLGPYGAMPIGGRHSFILPKPELYNLEVDPQESYDSAPEHQEIVAEIQSHVEKLLAGFPEPV